MDHNIQLPNHNLNEKKGYDQYEFLLKDLGFTNIVQMGFYLQVGKSNLKEGWILHISVINIHFTQLLKKITPLLITYNHTFCIPLNTDIHLMLQEGTLGYTSLGKIICIFPNPEIDLLSFAKTLIELTAGFKGPAIQTDIELGNLVYTKYGSYQLSETKYLLSPDGTKIIDIERIPFKIYPWIKWPFNSIKLLDSNKKTRIIHDRYWINKVIKNDSKGFVLKAIYQKNIFQYKKCIIKEGRMAMSSDNYGRDIEDRLIWQKELHDELAIIVKTPRAIELFKENSNIYLAIEYIKGKSFLNYLNTIFEGNFWDDISIKARVKIIDVLLQIVFIIKKLHQHQYLHRDINPENFMITSDDAVWVIDFELMFSIKKKFPLPPFEKGTEGYISPEQAAASQPTFEQDIYSIGGLLIMAFIHIMPHRINSENFLLLEKNLTFFLNDKELVKLILACLDVNPHKRPSLDYAQKTLENTQKKLFSGLPNRINKQIDQLYLSEIIKDSINTILGPVFLKDGGLWYSPVLQTKADSYVGNLRLDKTIYPGLKKGIGGILLILGKAAKWHGQELIKDEWKSNWNYLVKYYLSNQSLSPGLLEGSTGIAVCIKYLINGTLLSPTIENLKYLADCLDRIPNTLDIASGIAGYGIALIKCKDLLPAEFIESRLNICVQTIINNQEINGGWKFNDGEKNSKIILTGFYDGIAGILWFLLNYLQIIDNNFIKKKTLLALNYFISLSNSYKGYKFWPVVVGGKIIYNFSNGDYHLLLPFIKAYQVFGNHKYREIVEKILSSYPPRISSDLLSQENGISGLGEIYIEAWNTFKTEEWLNRANWIANHLIHTVYNKNNRCFWFQDDPYNPYADLLTGNSGIIHFLLRIQKINNSSYIF